MRHITLPVCIFIATALVAAPACDSGDGGSPVDGDGTSAGTQDDQGSVSGDDGTPGWDDGVTDPGDDGSGATDPGTEDPTTDDPGVDDPGTEDPGTDDPGTEDPIDVPNTVFDPSLDPPEGCSLGGFVANDGALSEKSNKVSFVGRSAADSDGRYDILDVQLYQSISKGGATEPGTYTLSGSFGDCGNCVLLRRGCQQDGAGETCDATFYADLGELEITTLGDTFAGSLHGVEAHEVTLDAMWNSTPVEGGQTWCLDGVAFSAQKPVEAIVGGSLGEGGTLQQTCVPEGTGKLIGNNVENFSLTNCLGEQVELHSGCGSTAALWLFGTAGWCGACSQTLAMLANEWGGGDISDDSMPTGIDMWVVLSEDQYGQKPSAAFCMQYAAAHNIDPAKVVMDWTDEETAIPLVKPEGYSLGVHAFGNTWQYVNPHLEQTGNGVSLFVPWHAVLRGKNMEYVWSSYYEESWALDEVYTVLLE